MRRAVPVFFRVHGGRRDEWALRRFAPDTLYSAFIASTSYVPTLFRPRFQLAAIEPVDFKQIRHSDNLGVLGVQLPRTIFDSG